MTFSAWLEYIYSNTKSSKYQILHGCREMQWVCAMECASHIWRSCGRRRKGCGRENGMLASSHVIAVGRMRSTSQIMCWKLIVSVTGLSCTTFRRWLTLKGRAATNEINDLMNELQRNFLSVLSLYHLLHETHNRVHHLEGRAVLLDSRSAVALTLGADCSPQ